MFSNNKIIFIAIFFVVFSIVIYLLFNRNNTNSNQLRDTDSVKDLSDKTIAGKTTSTNRTLNDYSWVKCDDLYDPTDPDEDSWREYMTCRFNNYHFVPTDDD